MPVYDYTCTGCYGKSERIVPTELRDTQNCANCGCSLHREVSAASFKFAGVAAKGGGPDRFTADMLGVPLKELPDGLKS